MEVKQTKRLSQFKILRENRNLHEPHVKRLIKVMEESGKNITASSPILVNKSLEVLDGQHRLAACKELGWPVHYLVVEGNIEDARQMNILHRTWRPLDYAHSYANKGNQSYINFLKLYDSFPQFSPTILMAIAYGFKQDGLSAVFRKGDFKLDDNRLMISMHRASMITEILEEQPELKQGAMLYALLNMITLEDYNHERFMSKFRKINETRKIDVYFRVRDNMRLLEEIYNYKTKNSIRFF